MKTIAQARDLHVKKSVQQCVNVNIDELESFCRIDFEAGVEYAQRWYLVEEDTPEYAEQLLLKRKDGTVITGYYLRHKYRDDAFYSGIDNDIEFMLQDVIEFRPIKLK